MECLLWFNCFFFHIKQIRMFLYLQWQEINTRKWQAVDSSKPYLRLHKLNDQDLVHLLILSLSCQYYFSTYWILLFVLQQHSEVQSKLEPPSCSLHTQRGQCCLISLALQCLGWLSWGLQITSAISTDWIPIHGTDFSSVRIFKIFSFIDPVSDNQITKSCR